MADLAAAVTASSVAGVSDVQPGGDDGEFTFMCVADGHKLNISALIPGRFQSAVKEEHLIFEFRILQSH